MSDQQNHKNYTDLIILFNRLFLADENTLLVSGGKEPLYLPADKNHRYHRIIFTRDYYASALHEVAHWCIAGRTRRQQIDYGYWYIPDGRDAASQKLFEAVEIKPQALQWIFSLAANFPFYISVDNLNDASVHQACHDQFKEKVYQQGMLWLKNGLPTRGERFARALLAFYRPEVDSLSWLLNFLVDTSSAFL